VEGSEQEVLGESEVREIPPREENIRIRMQIGQRAKGDGRHLKQPAELLCPQEEEMCALDPVLKNYRMNEYAREKRTVLRALLI